MYTFNFKTPQQEEEETHPKTIYTQYNPLKDLQETLPYNNPYTQQIYNLPTTPEHLFQEESHRTGRTLTGNITFYSGVSYAFGSVIGGVKGSVDGVKAWERGESMKIRINRVLNSGGLVGRTFGNNAGTLGLLYSVLDGGIKYKRGGVDDDLGSVLAGGATGALFRVFNGVRSVAVGGVLGGVVAAGFIGGTHLVKRFDMV